jgi:hypothetical protein
VHRKQKTKKEGDGNCYRLLWCTATKKQKKKVTTAIVAFLGALQPKNEKRR